MSRYTSVTDQDLSEMLGAIGAGSLEESPEKVNQDPYGDGWMVKVRLSDPSELDQLMDVGAYKELLQAGS